MSDFDDIRSLHTLLIEYDNKGAQWKDWAAVAIALPKAEAALERLEKKERLYNTFATGELESDGYAEAREQAAKIAELASCGPNPMTHALDAARRIRAMEPEDDKLKRLPGIYDDLKDPRETGINHE